MSACIIPGSFDPLTRGHLNLIERASGMFDRVTVTVMVNISKKGCIPYEERVRMIRKACGGFGNVEAELWTGLLADYMREHPGCFVLRGIRNTVDFEQEKAAAAVNRRLCPGMDTLLIPAAEEFGDLSSSTVREIAAFGGDFRAFVPKSIYQDIKKWLKPAKTES